MDSLEKNIDELRQNTNKLRSLITLAEKSGKASIDAGEILFDIRKLERYKVSHKSFSSYLRAELNVSETKAYSYIKIYETFKDSKANISPNILVTHLKLLADLDKSNRDLAFKSLANLEIEENNLFKQQEKEIKTLDLRPPYESADIQAFISIAENTQIENQEDANGLMKQLVEETKQSKEEKRQQQEIIKEAAKEVQQQIDYDEDIDEPLYYGDDLKSDYFDITDIFRYEPVDEQGLVGMFCSIFHLVKNKPFSLFGKEVSFKSIKIIRSAFPDGVIQIRNIGNDKKKYRDINIEFEFLSSNFIKHKHLEKGSIKCHLIICWENNIKGKIVKKYLTKLQEKKVFPQILSIKELLQTGKIELI